MITVENDAHETNNNQGMRASATNNAFNYQDEDTGEDEWSSESDSEMNDELLTIY